MGKFSKKVMTKKVIVCLTCLRCNKRLGYACVRYGGSIDPFKEEVINNEEAKELPKD